MCGRFALFRWNPAFAALPGFPADQQAQWNISPNDSVLIQRAADGQRTLLLRGGKDLRADARLRPRRLPRGDPCNP